MGRKTWMSLPPTFRLQGRLAFILTRSIMSCSNPDIQFFQNWSDLLKACLLHHYQEGRRLFIIGGSEIYQYALENLYVSRILLTQVDEEGPADVFLDLEPYLNQFRIHKREDHPGWSWITYVNQNQNPENRYLNLLGNVLYRAERRLTRNSVTISKFGERLEFDLQNGFPLLTTKRVSLKSIYEELMWFLRGHTDARRLDGKGVKIWNGNSGRKTLDSLGLSYREGDCGPIYGFQWRHFNAPYRGCESDYTDQGVDQIGEVIRLLRTDPTSRRILFTGWNPCQLGDMVLPPCHVLYQFYVESGCLSCQMYQRSADLFLGVPFNIASTALLTTLLAVHTGLEVGKVIVVFGDVHIYEGHMDVVEEQLTRRPYLLPRLNVKQTRERIEDYEWTDIELVGYESHSTLKADMVV